MNIIIADDSNIFRDRLKTMINGFENIHIVGEAVSGTTALQQIIAKEPDMVILDIRMPEINGIEVLKKIREINHRIKICMLTNYPYEQYKTKCIAEGADYFLDKNKEIGKIAEIFTQLKQAIDTVINK